MLDPTMGVTQEGAIFPSLKGTQVGIWQRRKGGRTFELSLVTGAPSFPLCLLRILPEHTQMGLPFSSQYLPFSHKPILQVLTMMATPLRIQFIRSIGDASLIVGRIR